MRRVALLCMLGLLGCKARAPKLELECTFDENCTLTTVGSDCCDSCEQMVGSAVSVSALFAYCAQRPATSCKKLDCPNTAATAFCENGHCLKRAGVH